MPNVVTASLGPTATAWGGTPADTLLDRLAERVARNREVLGVHYPSDSWAGQRLAGLIYTVLSQCVSVPAAIANARAEW
jgi:hypothetical protein